MKCPKCQHENPPESTFCGKCATRIQNSDLRASPTETLQTPVHELATGSTFAGRYQVIEELGRGGMGRVYRALDKEVNEEVALKLIRPEIASEHKTLDRFRSELRTARRVSHRSIGRMYELMEIKGLHFITMEYVPGEDLKSAIHRFGRLPVGKTLAIARQIAEGLAEAHRLGVVHRDLKPGNVMIDREGNARILDFGIARTLEEKGITGAGVMIGTPEYMSPEQAEGRDVDRRSDLYSLGIMLFEMVTGRAPFEGETPLAVAMKHKSEEPPSPKALDPQIPDDLSRVILRCLEKDKARRYQTAEELLADLSAIEKGIPTTERATARKPLTSREITVTFRLKKLIVPAAALLAVIAAGIVFLKVLPRKKSGPPPAVPPSAAAPANAGALLSEAWSSSIAVLPFVDMSPEKDQEYFCDGMTEDLINRLSSVRDLKVPARTSAFMFKGKTPDMREVGEKLKVRTALEGSVQKSANRLRITVQLINIADGYHLWSQRFDRELKDVFAIQDEISSAIVEALRLKLTSQERERLGGPAITRNLEAYNLYLQGRYFWNKRSTEDVKKAIDYFNRAIALDPDFALAYAGLADSYLVLPQFREARWGDVTSKAKEAALKALALDGSLAEAHVSLASVYNVEGDYAAAENGFKRALELDPNYPTGRHWYANLLSSMGRMDESLAEMKRALELDPLSLMIHVALTWLHLDRREYDQALGQALRAVELDPNFIYSRHMLGMCLRLKGMLKEATAELEKAREFFGGSPEGLGQLGMAYALSGETAKAKEVLSVLEESLLKGYPVNVEIASVYLGLGEKEKALEWLDKASKSENEIASLLDGHPFKMEPQWDSLRPDPRFKRLMKKLRLE